MKQHGLGYPLPNYNLSIWAEPHFQQRCKDRQVPSTKVINYLLNNPNIVKRKFDNRESVIEVPINTNNTAVVVVRNYVFHKPAVILVTTYWK